MVHEHDFFLTRAPAFVVFPLQETKPTTKTASPSKKNSGVFARLGNTLLAPTATFLARVTGKAGADHGDEKAHNKSGGLSQATD